MRLCAEPVISYWAGEHVYVIRVVIMLVPSADVCHSANARVFSFSATRIPMHRISLCHRCDRDLWAYLEMYRFVMVIIQTEKRCLTLMDEQMLLDFERQIQRNIFVSVT